jgi:hypothetical protein
MADDVKFTEDGLELHASVAEKMDDMLETAAAGAAVTVTLGGVLGAVVLIADLVKLMTDDDQTPQLLVALQRQIDLVGSAVSELRDRLNELVGQQGDEANRQRVLALDDLRQEVKGVSLDMQAASMDLDRAISIASHAGIVLDKFLRLDFDAWRWVDVVRDPRSEELSLRRDRFKSRPTLPIYLSAVLTWLAAREKVRRLGGQDRLDDDRNRIGRHLAAVSIRPTFDKYGMPPASIPVTITENIQSRIHAIVHASTKFPENGVCRYFFEVQNWMTGSRKRGDHFDQLALEPTDLCTVSPASLAMPNLELEAETAAGVPDLLAIAEVLQRVERTGTVAEQFIGVFPGRSAIFYIVESNGDLTWYENMEAAAPQGSLAWRGPSTVGLGWGQTMFSFNGGESAIYAVQGDGRLDWFGHNGHVDGSAQWSGPFAVGEGWARERVFPGGDGVIYAVLENGDLQWHRHLGAFDGAAEWVSKRPEERIVGFGWSGLLKAFAAGDGVIYTIDQEGVLKRFVHKGYLTGAVDWEEGQIIGRGFADFPEVIASGDLLYVFTRDGRVLRHRCVEREFLISFPPHGGAPTTEKGHSLEPAVEVRRVPPGFLRAFVRLPISGGVIVH